MRVLPAPIRPQIGTAYLLARATDTIADTEAVPVHERLGTLQSLRDHIVARTKFTFDTAAFEGTSAGEWALLSRLNEVLALVESFSEEDQRRIREVLTTIVSGQALDLQRFGEATADNVVALKTDDELDDYTYRVAGCVGEFWTHMCRTHIFARMNVDPRSLVANGTRFGKGLQLVNILRDIPADLRKGRCYVPSDALAKARLKPEALLDRSTEPRFRPVYTRYLNLAQDHLAAGWAYTNAIPRRCLRLRLACAWPVLIGARTVARLRVENVLDPARRVKISRREVRAILARSILAALWTRAWPGLFKKASS